MSSKHVTLKVGNMRKEQSFILYPYDGTDTIYLQSDQRWITANLRTGEGKINNKNVNYPTSCHLLIKPIDITLPDAIKTELQKYLWENDGQTGNIAGVVQFEIKKLFSE